MTAQQPRITPDEDRLLRELGEELEIVPRWVDAVGDPSGAWTAVAGSELAGDDLVSNPVTVSSGAWHAITASVSHIDCLRDSLFKWETERTVTVRISTHGQFSLIRGALENACRAVWLLEPDSRAERVLRRLQQDWAEQRQVHEVSTLIKSAAGEATTMEQRLAKLVRIAQKVGITDSSALKKMPGYGDIVKLASASVAGDSTLPYLIWKACSGLAHGDLRASLYYINVTPVANLSPGMVIGRISGSVPLLARGGYTAVAITKKAFELYQKRAGLGSPLGR